MRDVRRRTGGAGLRPGNRLRRSLCTLGLLVSGVACGPWATKHDPIVCDKVAKLRILPHPDGLDRPAGILVAMCDGRAVYEAKCNEVELRDGGQGSTDVFCDKQHVVRALKRSAPTEAVPAP